MHTKLSESLGWRLVRKSSLQSELGLGENGFAPGRTPPVRPPPPEYWEAVADLVDRPDLITTARRRQQGGSNQGVCDMFDWGSGVNLLTYETTVHDDLWGPVGDPWTPSFTNENFAGELKYCYTDMFASAFAPQPFDNREEFLMRWRGNITVEVEGRYELMTDSDDGSLLYVDRQRVVDNRGWHDRK